MHAYVAIFTPRSGPCSRCGLRRSSAGPCVGLARLRRVLCATRLPSLVALRAADAGAGALIIHSAPWWVVCKLAEHNNNGTKGM